MAGQFARGANLEGLGDYLGLEELAGTLMRTAMTYMRAGAAYNNDTPTAPIRIGRILVADAFMDLRDPAVLSRFVAQDGRPVDWGPDGSTALGSVPQHYLKGPASAIVTNLGAGADWSASGAGTLTDVA